MNSQVRILFVNPPSPDGLNYYRDTNRSGRQSKANEIWPQAGLAQFASLYPDHHVKLIDCIAEQMSYSALNDEMKRFRPSWVFFNPVTCTISSDMAVAYMAKQIGAKTAAISPHIKVLEKETLNEFPYLDYSIQHSKSGPEAEYKLREIITGESAKGTHFEDLPPARQDLLPIHKYSMPFIGNSYTAIIASRGCPYACIYCRTTITTERAIRYRHVESVIEEISKYKLTNFILHGDTMTLNKKWIYEFCKQVRNLPFKVRIVSNSRVDSVDLDLLKEMKSAGWWMISFGCESGSDRVLKLNRKEASVEDARKAVRQAKEAGLKVWGYFMLGMYGDTRESMERTLELSLSEPFDIVNFSISAPYPGTEWGNIAKENGWLVDQRWKAFDQNYSAQVHQRNLGVSTVKKFQKIAYYTWYLSHRGIGFTKVGLKFRYLGYFLKTAISHLI